MPLLGVEPLVDAVKTYIETNAAAKAAALNAEYADAITIAAPAAVYIAERQIASVPQYPAAVILALRERTDLWNLSAAGTGQTRRHHRLRIGFVDRSAAGASDELERKKWRYGRLLAELLIEADAANALAGHHMGTEPPTFELEWGDTMTAGSWMVSSLALDAVFHRQETKT